MKVSYLTPVCEALHFFPDSPMLTVSGNTWEDSIQDTGSNWGGVDTDDSVYGL